MASSIRGSPSACRPAPGFATVSTIRTPRPTCTSCRCGCHPTPTDIRPGYEQLDIGAEIKSGELVPIASGKHHESAITIHQRDAVLWGAQLAAGKRIDVPDDRHVHVFVARGSGQLDPGGTLATGDAARLTDADGLGFTAGPDGAEVLIWATA